MGPQQVQKTCFRGHPGAISLSKPAAGGQKSRLESPCRVQGHPDLSWAIFMSYLWCPGPIRRGLGGTSGCTRSKKPVFGVIVGPFPCLNQPPAAKNRG